MLRLLVFSALASQMIAANRDNKIVGGYEISLKNAPFAVSLQRAGAHFCGGSILTMSHVFSGCHCLSDVKLGCSHADVELVPLKRLSILAGTENIAKPLHYQRREVVDIKIHPNCTYELYLLYDFAVLLLSEPLIESEKVRPFALASNNKDVFDRLSRDLIGDTKSYCYVAGWGSTQSKPGEGGHVSNAKLKAARMILIPDTECADYLRKQNDKWKYNFGDNGLTCSLPHARHKNESDCIGDSGGPFFCGSRVYAIVSFGYECGEWEKPNVYAKLSFAIDWLGDLNLKSHMRSPDMPSMRSKEMNLAVPMRPLPDLLMLLIFTTRQLTQHAIEG